MPLASRFVLIYIATLNRMDVVPNRELYNFYRKSLYKRDKVENGFNNVNNSENEESRVNGVAPVKPPSPPPPPPPFYIPPIEHPRVPLYSSSCCRRRRMSSAYTHAAVRVRITVQLDV